MSFKNLFVLISTPLCVYAVGEMTSVLATDTSNSVGSIDEILNVDGTDPVTDVWRAELADRIEEILARKGSTLQGREKAYKTYVQMLTAQYAEEEIRGKESELVVAFLKSIKEERSEKETILAIKGTPRPTPLITLI